MIQRRYNSNHILSLFILTLAVLFALGHLRAVTNAPVEATPLPLTAEIPAEPAIQVEATAIGLTYSSQEQSFREEERQEVALHRASLSSRGAQPASPANLPARRPAMATVPILMYHHIATVDASADDIRRDLSVSPANFAAQLSYLARNGYHTVSLTDLLAHLEKGQTLPPRAIVLTFDDGYLDNYTQAFPLLKERGFNGTFFMITDFVGHGEYMSWEQAREMHAGGMDLESHTLNHPDLSKISAAQAARQLTESRAVLENRLGKTVRYLSYPAGRYSPEVIRLAQQAGYEGAVTTVYGDTHVPGQPFELVRVRIRGNDSLETFARKVIGPDPKPPQPTRPVGVQ